MSAVARCPRKRVNSTLSRRYLWAGGHLVAELNASGPVLNRYVYGSRAHTPDYVVNNGTTYRIVNDERGSVHLVVNTSTGQPTQQLDYDEWGRVTADSNPNPVSDPLKDLAPQARCSTRLAGSSSLPAAPNPCRRRRNFRRSIRVSS